MAGGLVPGPTGRSPDARAQRSNATSQRGWNGQPVIGSSSRGGAPRMDTTSSGRRTGRAWRRTAAGCRGGGAGGTASSIGPLSTISPAYMTAARPQVWATTGRSWVTSTSARPSSRRQPGQQVQDLCLHHHVQRRGRLVGQQDPGLAGQRHGDRRALPHAAGELVRVAVRARRPGCRPSPAARRPAAGPPRPARCRGRPSARRSASRPSSPGSGRSSRPGTPSRCPSSGSRGPSPRRRPGCSAVDADLARTPIAVGGSRPISGQDRGRLAAPGLADQPEPLARGRVRSSPLDRVHLRPCGRSNQTCRSGTSSRLISRPAPGRPAAGSASGGPTGGPPSAAGSARPRWPARAGSSRR